MGHTQEGWLHVRKGPSGRGTSCAEALALSKSTSHKEHKEKITWKRLKKLRGGGMQGVGQAYTALSKYLS